MNLIGDLIFDSTCANCAVPGTYDHLRRCRPFEPENSRGMIGMEAARGGQATMWSEMVCILVPGRQALGGMDVKGICEEISSVNLSGKLHGRMQHLPVMNLR